MVHSHIYDAFIIVDLIQIYILNGQGLPLWFIGLQNFIY